MGNAMRRILLFAFMAVVAVACRRDYAVVPPEETSGQDMRPAARITETIRYDQPKCTAYNIEYPSRDPFGNPVTLSGTITIGDEIVKGNPARGLFLYNRYTSYSAEECPSRGHLGVQKIMVGSGLITISPDFYGFGATQDKHQAYGLADTNGEASADALVAAIDLLSDMGYTWDNFIFNMGYSQGGQSAIAALKMLTQKYPAIRLTRTFAGGGLYDVKDTYLKLASCGETSMPDVVISAILAYNEFYRLDIPLDRLFKEPLLSNLDQLFFSKKKTLQEIGAFMETDLLEDYLTPQVLDFESDISKQLCAATDKENLCRGWKPRPDEKVTLVHNKSDEIVPVQNTENLIRFFEDHGLIVHSRVEEFGGIPDVFKSHYVGAVPFILDTFTEICATLGISLWVDASQVIKFVKDLPLS